MQTNVSPNIKRRNPLLALFMSAILPGFGQLYNGEVHKALWLFLVFALLSVPAIAMVALYLPVSWTLPSLFSGLLLLLALWLYGMGNAFRSARRQMDYQPQPWQSAGVYLMVLLVCGTALPLLSAQIRQYWVEAMLVPSSSMEPNVMKSDLIFADKRYNRVGATQALKRGDIAIFVYPNERSTYYIKRIIGLPGDEVSIKGAEVSINGKPLRLRTTPVGNGLLVTETDSKTAWQVFWNNNSKLQLPQTKVRVPAGQVFMMGDNRTDSNDSRFFGTVPLQDVVGKARQVWFSAQGNRVRWERIGKLLH